MCLCQVIHVLFLVLREIQEPGIYSSGQLLVYLEGKLVILSIRAQDQENFLIMLALHMDLATS